MRRTVTTAFFKATRTTPLSTPPARSANAARTATPSNHPILRAAFYEPKDNVESLAQVRAKINALDEKINETSAALDKKLKERKSLHQSELTLEEPRRAHERAVSDLKEVSAVLSNAIFSFIIEGKTEAFASLPTATISRSALGFVKPLLDQYQITYKIETVEGQDDSHDVLKLKIPKEIPAHIELKQTSNEECNRWLHDFNQSLRSAYNRAENKIENDYNALQYNLLEPLKRGDEKVFYRFNPCGVAFQRFQKSVECINAKVTQENGLVLVEASDNHHFYKPY